MYTIPDVVEMGEAHELVLSVLKDLPFSIDDTEAWTMRDQEPFD